MLRPVADGKQDVISYAAVSDATLNRPREFVCGKFSRLMGRFLAPALAGMAALAFAAPAHAEQAGVERRIEVEYQGGMISVEAVDAPLSEVLLEIGRRSGIETRVSGDLDEPVNRSLKNVSVENAVRGLADHLTFVLIHGAAPAGGETSGIAQLWVYGNVDGSAAPTVVAVPAEQDPDGSPAALELAYRESEAVRRLAAEVGRARRAGRLHAVQSMARQGDETALAAVGRLLVDDPHPEVRREAASALGRTGSEAVIPLLEAGLGDEDPGVRAQVVGAVAVIGGERALRDLGQVALGDRDPDLRRIAVEHLAGDPREPARAFLEAAAKDPSPLVREAARQALGLE